MPGDTRRSGRGRLASSRDRAGSFPATGTPNPHVGRRTANIVCTMARGRGGTDLPVSRLARRLAGRGLRTCGTVQINTERVKAGPCDICVMILPDRPVVRISQDLGAGAKESRLDTDALERAVAWVEARLPDGADVLIVNKFGMHEAEGRGFRTVLGAALADGIPVVFGLNRLNFDAFQDVSGGLAQRLPPDLDAIEHRIFERRDEFARAG